MTQVVNHVYLSLICLVFLSGQLFADGHSAHGVLNFDGATVGVEAFVSVPDNDDPTTVDLVVTYDLSAYMAQLRNDYSGIQTLDACGDRVIFNPPQLMLAQDSGEVSIGSMAIVEDWTCDSRTRDEQHGLAWAQVAEQQRSRAATTAFMDYSVPFFGVAMTNNTIIRNNGEPTADSIFAMRSFANAVSNDISDASASLTWWNNSPEIVASTFGTEEYKRFLDAYSQADFTIDGEAVRLAIKADRELASGWATFITTGPEAAIDLD